MDKVAYVCAAKHAGNYCVTASIDTVNFLAPVEVGELVSFMASVNYVGRTSLVVGIRVVSENVKTNVIKHTNTSYFTMVAKNEHNEPVEVPGLLLENHDQVRRFEDARRRKIEKLNYAAENKLVKKSLNINDCKIALANERCIIELIDPEKK
jgi:acyl-CoA hydrolase